MAASENSLAIKITELIESVGGWQNDVLDALQNALAAANGVDHDQLITLIDQHLSDSNTLNRVTSAMLQDTDSAQQIRVQVSQQLSEEETLDTVSEALLLHQSTVDQLQQLIEQYSADEVVRAVQNVMQHMPDLSSVVGMALSEQYNTGQVVTYHPTGASTASGESIIWHLTDLVGVTATETQISDGQSTQLTFLDAGGMTVTAVANNVAAASRRYTWGVSPGVIAPPVITSPAAGTTNVVLQPVITSSAYSVTPEGYDNHLNSQFRALKNGTVVWDSGPIAATTEIAVSADLPAESELDLQVRYEGSLLGWGHWSNSVRIATRSAGGAGYVYSDGGIGGPIVDGYQLIVAPGVMRSRDVLWGLEGVSIPELANITSYSTVDPKSGFENTRILIDGYSDVPGTYAGNVTSVGAVAAVACRDRGSEWFLPNKEELAAILEMSDQIDAADSQSGLSFNRMIDEPIWSSSIDNSGIKWSYVVTKKLNLSTGLFYNDIEKRYRHSDDKCFVVPVRREPV